MESRQIRDGGARFELSNDVEDLLLGIPFSLHASSSVPLNLHSGWHWKRGEGQQPVLPEIRAGTPARKVSGTEVTPA